MIFTAPPPLAVEPKAISISQYEALTSDIQIAKQQAVESFDYNDPKGDKAARSYIAGLRKIRSRIESARKEAKSYALEYGRAVDAQAKALEAEILGLIEPHQQALDEIAQQEAAAEAARSVAEAERRVKESEARAFAAEQLRQQQEAARQQEDKRRAIAQQEAKAALRRAEVTRRNDLAAELSNALASKTRAQVVDALLDGTLHPAVSIDWAKA
jgi:hypothetical protein